MGEVLPLSSSPPPRDMFLCIWMVKKVLEAVVLNYKKFRSILPGPAGPVPDPADLESYDGRPYMSDYDTIWYALIGIPFTTMFIAALHLTNPEGPYIYAILLFISAPVFLWVYAFVMHAVMYWYHDVPYALMGAKAKFMIEVTPVIASATLRQSFEFNHGILAFVMCCTVNFYMLAHFLHIAYDIGLMDLLLESVMFIVVYMVTGGFLVRASWLGFFLVLCFCRYLMYCAPELPVHHRKQELEQLPC